MILPTQTATEVMLKPIGKTGPQVDEVLTEWKIPPGRLGTHQILLQRVSSSLQIRQAGE